MQPDSLIPDTVNPQALNRYSYVGNRPVNFNDPTGHKACGDGESFDCDGKKQDPNLNLYKLPKKDKEENCKGLNCLHNRDDDDIILPTVVPTFATASSTGTPRIDNKNVSNSDCPKEEKCNHAEAIAGVALIVITDLTEAVFLIIATAAAGPIGAAEVLETTAPLWIPVNIIGAYMIFDSGVVSDFNRTAWGLK